MNTEILNQYTLFASDPRHKLIRFEENTHSYYYTDPRTGKEEKWSGVTTLIKNYQKKQDWEAVAKGVAFKRRREGEFVTPEEVQAEWKQVSDKASLRGTSIHESIETWVKTKKINPEHEDIIATLNEHLEFWGLIPMDAEVVVYDERIKCASMIDIVCYSPEENAVIPVDTKTMEKGVKFKGYKGQKMLYPFGKYEDCDFSKFSIQLGMYERWLKRKYNVKTGRGYIFHTGENGFFPVRNVQKEIDEMYTLIEETKAPWE